MIIISSHLRRTSVLRMISLITIIIIFLSSTFFIPNSNNITEIDRDFNKYSQKPFLADNSPTLFEGNEIALNITDYGNLYTDDQQVEVNSQESVNLT